MTCNHISCKEAATHYPLICCPPKDKVCGNLELFLSIPLCRGHAKRYELQEFINGKSPNGIGTNAFLFEMGFRPHNTTPDLAHAYVRALRMDSPEAKKWISIGAKKNGTDKPISTEG